MAQKTALYETFRDFCAQTMETVCQKNAATLLEQALQTNTLRVSRALSRFSFLGSYKTKEIFVEVSWSRLYSNYV